MLPCPRCRVELVANRSATGVHYVCPRCYGRMANIALMRRVLDKDFVNNLWAAVRDAPPATHREAVDCPSCAGKMHAAAVGTAGQEFQLDICRHCQILWLDHGELEALPAGEPPAEPGRATRLPADAPVAGQEEFARYLIERSRRDGKWRESPAMPDEWWKVVMTFFGFPVEEDAPEPARRPWVTWTVAAACVAATCLAWWLGAPQSVDAFGFLPARPWRLHGLTVFTAFFLHGGITHLLGNVWFLLLAGDNCEDLLGWPRYLLLLACGLVGGAAAHAGLDPRGMMPVIGASGGISAVMAYYALSLPRVRLVMCIRWFIYPFWFRLSVMWAILAWLVLQAGMAMMQWNGHGTVSAIAHLGGAATGGIFWWLNHHGFTGRRPGAGDFSDPKAVAEWLARGK